MQQNVADKSTVSFKESLFLTCLQCLFLIVTLKSRVLGNQKTSRAFLFRSIKKIHATVTEGLILKKKKKKMYCS